MPFAPEAMPNQIANQVVVELSKISADNDAPHWLTTPKTVVRGGVGSIPKVEVPALIVSVPFGDDTPQQAFLHETKTVLRVWLVVDDGDQVGEPPEALLWQLARDVITAMTNNEQLTRAGTQLIETMSGPSVHMDDEGSDRFGRAIGRIEWTLTYKWSHGAP